MSYGNGVQFDKANPVFFNYCTKDKDGNKVSPFFQISKLINGKVEKTDETCTNLRGDLVKILVEDVEFKGVPGKRATLYLKDDSAKELYVLKNSFRMDTRSLYNAILNLNAFKDVSISVYANKKGFPAFSLRQNEERVSWKYSLEELPEPEAVTFKGKQMKDFSSVDNFIADELIKLNSHLSGKKSETPIPVPSSPINEDKKVNDEDVPF
jgi:hypothetical protein